jgi:hypothetical protein
MTYNYDFFYIFNTNKQVINNITDIQTYYGAFYNLFNGSISFNEFKVRICYIFDEENKKNPNFYSNIILKLLKYIIDYHLGDFDCVNYIKCDDDCFEFIYNFDKDNSITNHTLYNIYITILNDKNKIINYYYKYYQNIFENLDLNKYPMEIIICDKNKLEIFEGTHRFLFSYIKKIKPNFIIKESKYELFNNIMDILNNDYEMMYKINNDKFIIYNKIPQVIFSNFETIREDRSKYIIDFLNKYNFKNGLEIGPQNGLLSIQLSKEYYNMQCIEYEKKYYTLTNYIIQLCDVNSRCLVLYGDITKCYKDIQSKYDFIVSLSVFYHLKRNNQYLFENLFIELIKSTKVLIFDDEANTNIFTINDIKNYISKISNITLEIIYTGEDNRTIYAIIQT